MRLKLSWSSLIPPSRLGVPLVFITLLLLAIDANSAAQALPSFARQTGQPCGTCHTDFPGLTPYGRAFKLGGYTAGGRPVRAPPVETRKTARAYDGAVLAERQRQGRSHELLLRRRYHGAHRRVCAGDLYGFGARRAWS